jgi:hypothetical protein
MGIKVGLLVDDTCDSKYVRDLVEWSKTTPDVGITHLIIHSRKSNKSGGRISKLTRSLFTKGIGATTDWFFSKLFMRAISVVERKLLDRSDLDRDHLSVYELGVPNQINIHPIISESGFVYRFSDADVEHISSLGLDVLIRCGSGILRGGILGATKYGVWSFHHADNRINRGGPAGFWEVFHEDDATGFTIQRLTEELDGGDVMMRGHVQTQYYYLLNQAALYRKSNHYMKLLLSRLARGSHPNILDSTPYSERLFRDPDARSAAMYFIRLLRRVLVNQWNKLRGIESCWNVGFVRSGWRDAVLWRETRLPNPPNRFLADPFVVSRSGSDYCFVEDFDCQSERGKIAVYILGSGAYKRLGTALDEPFHLSFPYIFEFDGEFYMCPESAQDKSIRIYRCTDFPLKWELAKVIMKDVSAVDSMLFEHGGKWWLFTNTDPARFHEYFELSVFWAATPLADHWQPHAQNPIYVDSRYARNGGLLRDGSSLFRVCQRQGFNTYGKAATIREVIELSETTYREAEVCQVLPHFAEDIVGIHHMHSSGKMTVFDMVGSFSHQPLKKN